MQDIGSVVDFLKLILLCTDPSGGIVQQYIEPSRVESGDDMTPRQRTKAESIVNAAAKMSKKRSKKGVPLPA
jgi:hypothetical protein